MFKRSSKLGSKKRIRYSLLAAVTVAFVILVQATWADDFQPKTYTSPSGKYLLSVNPSERSGAGKAHYALKHNGEVAWSGDQPFTFWDAFVTEDGTIGGYAYSEGYSRDAGEFVVALLDAKGNMRLTDKTPRKWSPFLHTAADPKANGIFFQPETDRFVVRVRDPDLNENAESWWTYRLSDGHLLGKPKPHDALKEDMGSGYIVAARPVANTPLTLIHWVRLEGNSLTSAPKAGALYTLVDADNKPVWKLDLPDDYTNRQDEKAELRLLEEIGEHGGILDSTQPARFTLRHAAAGLRVTYVAKPSSSKGGTWEVKETARTGFSGLTGSESKVDSSSEIPEVSLKKLSSIDLAKQGSSSGELSPIRDVSDFVPAEASRFGVLSGCSCEDKSGKHSLVIVNDTGKLVREIALPVIPGGGFIDHLAWLKGDAWIVTTSSSGQSGKSSAVRVDADTGLVTPLSAFDAPPVDSIVGLSDGGFIALMKEYKTFTIENTIAAFDERGNRHWEIHEGDGDAEIHSPEGVAVATTGEVVVLENIWNRLKIYSPEGKHRSTISLRDAWGREPNYPSGLHADSTGGVLVHDFNGSPAIVRMSLSGDVLGGFTPTYKDGRRFDIRGDVKSSPTGELWTSDAHALLRLDKQGVVDRVLGDKPNFESLGNIAAVMITSKGWIYAADERTGAVHVFNENGELQHVCRPDVSDYKSQLSLPSLTVSDSGDVFITHAGVGDARPDFLHYDAKGQRVGIEKVALEDVAQAWLSQPGSTNRWVLGYDRAYLVNSDAAILRRIDRTADGQWVETPGPGSVAPDGSIAMISGAGGDPMSRKPPKILVTIFAANGDPTITWPAPDHISTSSGGIAFGGERLAFILESGDQEMPAGILVTNKRGSALFKAPLKGAHYGAGVFFVDMGAETQLWLFDGKSTIDRFALPDR